MALPNQKITPKGELPDPTRFFDLVGSLAEWFVWAMNWRAYVTLFVGVVAGGLECWSTAKQRACLAETLENGSDSGQSAAAS